MGLFGLNEDASDVVRILIANDSKLEKRILFDGIDRFFPDRSRLILESCSRGDDALDYILKENPDMVFLDWVLPGIEGPEICRSVREKEGDDDSGYCYIVMTTSMDDRSSIAHGLSSGADDFITKPFHSEDIEARITVGLRLVEAYRKVLRQKEAIDRMSRTDELTGILNRRYVLSCLEKSLDRAQRENRSLSICLCDVDFFKHINDNYGHQAGDFVLRKLGYFMETFLEKHGVAGRYGGDEFLFVLPEADEAEAKEIVCSLYERISSAQFVFNGKELPISLSCGLSFVLSPMEHGMWNSSNLIKMADDALYEAKRRGKNRICFYSDEGMEEISSVRSYQDLA